MVKWEQRLIDLDIAAEFETALKQFPFSQERHPRTRIRILRRRDNISTTAQVWLSHPTPKRKWGDAAILLLTPISGSAVRTTKPGEVH